MKVQIDIGRLVIDGLDIPAHHRPALQAAVEGELARLVREGGVGSTVPTSGSERARPSDAITAAPDTSAATLGGRIAAAVYGSLRR